MSDERKNVESPGNELTPSEARGLENDDAAPKPEKANSKEDDSPEGGETEADGFAPPSR